MRETTMGRELKRVPLDFDAPLDEIWEGYWRPIEDLKEVKEIVDQVPEILGYEGDSVCRECNRVFGDCDEYARYCIVYNKDLCNLWYFDPPEGEGYQLWETTTEGSPQSPVFATLDELCEWCEENATTFGYHTATKEQWFEMLSKDDVHHRSGNVTFL